MVSPSKAKINHLPPGEVAASVRAPAELVLALAAVGAFVALGAAAALVALLDFAAEAADEELAVLAVEVAVIMLAASGVGVDVHDQFCPSKAQAAPVVALP